MHMLGSGAWKRNLLIALFFLSLASSISFSLEPFSELAGSVDISLHMQGSTAVVKASYLDFSYYKKDDLSTLPTDPSQFHQPGPTSTQEITYSQKPLIKPKLYFTFDGYKIAGAGGAASCDPVVGSDLGEASCTVFGYIDGTGALKKLEDIQSCGSIMVEYRGESDTPNTHTTSAAIQYCPRRTQAIGALGPAIASVFSSPAVFPICFPVMLIVGMLVASMYYSGRDPLSLFDLTTPRLPRVKPFRIKGGVAPQMIRSMIRRYNKNMMMFQKYLVDSVVGAAENAKMNTAQAKRKANALASGYKRELEKMKLAGKTDPAEYKALTDKYDRAARKLMDKYKPADGKTYQYWADLNETAPKVFQQIYAQWDAKNAMGAARGPGGGIIWKKGSAFWDKMTNASIKFEETKFNQFIQQTPPNASRLTRIVTWPLRAPVKALINGPTRFFDVMMQFRASRVGQRRMTRMLAIGTPLYLALTKKDKQTGERNLRELGKKIQSQFVTKDANGKDKLTGLGAFVKKWKGLEFNKFLDEHNLMRRKAMEIFNFVAFAKFDAVHLLRVKEEVLYSQSLKDVRENQIDELIRAIKTDVKNTVKDKKLSADDQKKMILLYVEVINRMREFRRGTAEQREYQYENLELKVISLTDALKSHLGKSKLASYTQTEKWKETEKFMQALIKNEYKNSNGEIVGDTHEKFAEILKYAKNNKIELTVTEQILKEHKALEHAIASRLLLTRELSEKLDKKGESISRESIEAVSEKKLNDYRTEYAKKYEILLAAALAAKGIKIGDDKQITKTEKLAILAFIKNDLATELRQDYGWNVRGVNINGKVLRDPAAIALAAANAAFAAIEGKGGKNQVSVIDSINVVATARMAVKFGSVSVMGEKGKSDMKTVCLALASSNELKNYEKRVANYVLMPGRVEGMDGKNGFYLIASAIKKQMERHSEIVDVRLAEIAKKYGAAPKADDWTPHATNLLKVFGKNPEGVFLYEQLEKSGVLRAALDRIKAEKDIEAKKLRAQGMPAEDFDIAKERKKIMDGFHEKGINAMELLFQKGQNIFVRHFRDELAIAVTEGRLGREAKNLGKRAGLPTDAAVVIGLDIMGKDTKRFVRSWAADMNNGLMAYYGAADARGKAFSLLGYAAHKEVEDKAQTPQAKDLAEKRVFGAGGGKFLGEASEKSKLEGHEKVRWQDKLRGKDLPVSPYSGEMENSLLEARRYTAIGMQIIGSKINKENAATWGEHAYSLLNQNIRESRDQRGTVRELYKSLVTPGSMLYDAAFAEKMKDVIEKKYGKGADITKYTAEGHEALIERGIKYGDRFKGLATQTSGDRRGALPLLEYDTYTLDRLGYVDKDKNGKILSINSVMMRDDIKKADSLRDYSALAARLNESWYSNLPSGLLSLSKLVDASGKVSWQYRSPYDNPMVSQLMQGGQMKINPFDRQGATEALVGYSTVNGKKVYNPQDAQLKMITTQSFAKYVKDNPSFKDGDGNSSRFFGDQLQRFAGIRASIISKGLTLAENTYVATAAMSERHTRWYASQIHVRNVMESMMALMKEQAVVGTERFKFEGHDDFLKAQKSTKELQKILDDERNDTRSGKTKTVEKILSEEMVRLEKGKQANDATYHFLENPQAFWYGFRRNIASRTYGMIAEAETKMYSANLELRALENMRIRKEIGATEYSTLKSDVQSRLNGANGYNAEYKIAKDLYTSHSQNLVSFLGSHSDSVAYGSYRNRFNMGGLAATLLDSRWKYGMFGENYASSESAVMRDPRIATGAGQGLDNSFYVGYQTGQNVYERGWMWTVNASWEAQMNPYLNVSRAAVMFFNNFVSYGARKASHYPAYFEQDFMNPGEHGKGKFLQSFISPLMLNINQTSDWFRARVQSAVDYSGVATMIGTYQQLGSQNPHARNTMQHVMDKYFVESAQQQTLAHIKWLQRPMDRYAQFERVMNDIVNDDRKDNELRDEYVKWLVEPAGTDEKIKIWQTKLKPLVEIFDLRPRGSQEGLSGIDQSEDGGKSRFFELYAGFYLNTWRPIMPGTMDFNPVTQRWVPTAQIASYVMHDTSMSMNTSNFFVSRQAWVDMKDQEGKIMRDEQGAARRIEVHAVSDYMNYEYDAMRDTYRRDGNMLMHQLKLQGEWFIYAPLRTPSMAVINPVWWAFFNGGLENSRMFKWIPGVDKLPSLPKMLYTPYDTTTQAYQDEANKFENNFRSLTQKGTKEFSTTFKNDSPYRSVIDLPNRYSPADVQRELAEKIAKDAVRRCEYYRNMKYSAADF